MDEMLKGRELQLAKLIREGYQVKDLRNILEREEGENTPKQESIDRMVRSIREKLGIHKSNNLNEGINDYFKNKENAEFNATLEGLWVSKFVYSVREIGGKSSRTQYDLIFSFGKHNKVQMLNCPIYNSADYISEMERFHFVMHSKYSRSIFWGEWESIGNTFHHGVFMMSCNRNMNNLNGRVLGFHDNGKDVYAESWSLIKIQLPPNEKLMEQLYDKRLNQIGSQKKKCFAELAANHSIVAFARHMVDKAPQLFQNMKEMKRNPIMLDEDALRLFEKIQFQPIS